MRLALRRVQAGNLRAFEFHAFAAAEQSGKSPDLERELTALFERENKSKTKDVTSVPATFLKVTVTV